MQVKISPVPAKFEGGFMSILLSRMIDAPSEVVEVRNGAELTVHVERIRAALPVSPPTNVVESFGTNGWHISILKVRGTRAFAGFDAWERANRSLLNVQAAQS